MLLYPKVRAPPDLDPHGDLCVWSSGAAPFFSSSSLCFFIYIYLRHPNEGFLQLISTSPPPPLFFSVYVLLKCVFFFYLFLFSLLICALSIVDSDLLDGRLLPFSFLSISLYYFVDGSVDL